jgi:hypothetical protein
MTCAGFLFRAVPPAESVLMRTRCRNACANAQESFSACAVLLNQHQPWFLRRIFVRFPTQDVAIESFGIEIPVIAIVQRAPALETPKTAQRIGPFSDHHASKYSKTTHLQFAPAHPNARAAFWFLHLSLLQRNRSELRYLAKEFINMPIFFMLPFIILQGMLEVALDEVRVKAKSPSRGPLQ